MTTGLASFPGLNPQLLMLHATKAGQGMRLVDGWIFVSLKIDWTQAATPPTVRLSVGGGHYHHSTVKEGSEESLKDHGINNVCHLNDRTAEYTLVMYCSVL